MALLRGALAFMDYLAGPWIGLIRTRTCVYNAVSHRNALLAFYTRYSKSNEAGGAGRGVRQRLPFDNQNHLHSRKTRSLPLQ